MGSNSADELVGLNAGDFYVNPEEQLSWREAVERADVLHNSEIQMRRKDGTVIWARDSGRIVRDDADGHIRYEGTLSDVTERKAAEEHLRQSEAALRKAQHVSHVGSWVWHIQPNRVEWSEEMVRIFGVDQDAFDGDLSQVIASAIHPEDRGAVERANEAVIREQRPSPLEYRILRPDGEVRTLWAEAGELVLDDAGRPAILTGVVQDITERKKAELSLRESEERYRDLVENIHELICTHDVRGRVLSFNRSAIELTGYAPDELLGIDMRELLPPDHRPLFERYLATVLKTGAANGLMTIVTRHGERRIWEYHNTLRTHGVTEPIVPRLCA